VEELQQRADLHGSAGGSNSRQGRSGRAAASAFVAVTAVLVAVMWWSLSVPGLHVLPFVATGCLLLAVALICAAMLTQFVVDRWRGRRPPVPRYLAVIAAMAVLVLVSWFTPLPVRVRFELSRSAFDDYAEQVLADTDGIGSVDPWDASQDSAGYAAANPPAPSRLGTFGIRSVKVVPEGLIIFDSTGAFLDDAGFAYLPDGRFPAGNSSFESPDFRSLGGGWYAFTSSW
jgi:hypothetical protein